MEKLVTTLMSTYMGDYQWPYLPSQNYRADGECYYYPTIYNPMDYYLNLPTREDLQYSCKTGMSEHFAPSSLQQVGGTCSNRPAPASNNPHNNLHCTCIECTREMKCADARMDFRERYPYIYKPEDKQLTKLNEMMAKLKKDQFCSVYENSYSRDSCKLYRYHNTVPCEEPIAEGDASSQEESPECFALNKPMNPLQFRKYPSAQTKPTFKKGQERHASSHQGTEELVRPWHSEYMDGISKVGGNIMDEQIHVHQGPVKHAPKAPA